MTLTLKQKAMLHTAGIIIAAIVASTAIHIVLDYLTKDQIFGLFMITLFGFFVHLMYSIVLNRLETEELTKARHKMVDQ